ncbi:hypothetical protein MMC18_000412 [Xylographa bjoerkii]|nr:hypothetical protein [Xylographa bjoerkii]
MSSSSSWAHAAECWSAEEAVELTNTPVVVSMDMEFRCGPLLDSLSGLGPPRFPTRLRSGVRSLDVVERFEMETRLRMLREELEVGHARTLDQWAVNSQNRIDTLERELWAERNRTNELLNDITEAALAHVDATRQVRQSMDEAFREQEARTVSVDASNRSLETGAGKYVQFEAECAEYRKALSLARKPRQTNAEILFNELTRVRELYTLLQQTSDGYINDKIWLRSQMPDWIPREGLVHIYEISIDGTLGKLSYPVQDTDLDAPGISLREVDVARYNSQTEAEDSARPEPEVGEVIHNVAHQASQPAEPEVDEVIHNVAHQASPPAEPWGGEIPAETTPAHPPPAGPLNGTNTGMDGPLVNDAPSFLLDNTTLVGDEMILHTPEQWNMWRNINEYCYNTYGLAFNKVGRWQIMIQRAKRNILDSIDPGPYQQPEVMLDQARDLVEILELELIRYHNMFDDEPVLDDARPSVSSGDNRVVELYYLAQPAIPTIPEHVTNPVGSAALSYPPLPGSSSGSRDEAGDTNVPNPILNPAETSFGLNSPEVVVDSDKIDGWGRAAPSTVVQGNESGPANRVGTMASKFTDPGPHLGTINEAALAWSRRLLSQNVHPRIALPPVASALSNAPGIGQPHVPGGAIPTETGSGQFDMNRSQATEGITRTAASEAAATPSVSETAAASRCALI